jgi:hypothetical protein
MASAITYARRYALMALAGVAPADDDGNAACGRMDPVASVAGSEAAGAKIAVLARRRKTSAQAKRDGDFERLRDQITCLESSAALDLWFALYQQAEAPMLPRSWADPICDRVESRRNDLHEQTAEAA